jgi:hypothetical protein
MKTLAVATDLHKQSEVLRDEYLNAKPWPHVVIENGFPEDFLDVIAREVANIDQSHIISSLDVRQIKQDASQGFGPATIPKADRLLRLAFASRQPVARACTDSRGPANSPCKPFGARAHG